MSNVASIILTLQEKLKTTDNALDLATYAKMIEKLQLNSIAIVSTFFDLPILEDNGNIYLVESEEELYYNVGTAWFSLGNITVDILYAWGANSGKLGDGTVVNTFSPVTVVGGITNGWTNVGCGRYHSLGIANGIAYAWGSNGGRLGDGTTITRSSPVTVVGGITNWTNVATGAGWSLGVTETGIAYSWGADSYGNLGTGVVSQNTSSPVTIVGGITGWASVSAGLYHSLGIADGIAYGWGRNYRTFVGPRGAIGDGTVINRSSPVTVVGGITNWKQVSAGLSEFSLGVTTSGIAYGWGVNGGRLGDGTTITRSSPVTVAGGIVDWSQVSAGLNHSIALTLSGTVYAWGANGFGQLGDGTTSGRLSPATVIGGITNWISIDSGSSHNVAITADGIAYAWGANSSGELGDGTNINTSSPVTVIGGITNWTQASAGYSHAVAIVSNTIKTYIT